jgi:hypothetical protein
MVAILVHWLIKKGCEAAFEARWNEMRVESKSGLFREVLTNLRPPSSSELGDEERFHTFSIGDPYYATYINIGFWDSLESFDMAIGKYIPSARLIERDGKQVRQIELDEFEFKLRERVVLSVIGSRGGDLPAADVP